MAPRAKQANLFEVTGGTTSVTYATSGIAGRPSFHYRDADHDVHAEGADIRVKKTEVGTLVTIDIEVVPDLRTVSASLVVPALNMGGETERKLRTLVIVTTAATTIGGPSLVMGQVQRYRSITVRGTARSVVF